MKKRSKYVFSEHGEKCEVPNERPADGSLSFKEGFTERFEKNPERGGKYIDRKEFNTALYTIHQEAREALRFGAARYDDDYGKQVGYQFLDKVIIYYNQYTGELLSYEQAKSVSDDEKHMLQPYSVVSHKDDNKDSPLLRENLFKSWWVDDGVPFMGLIMVGANLTGNVFSPPPGYLDVGDSNASSKEYYSHNHPRVQKLLVDSSYKSCGYFIGVSQGYKFRVLDVRGRFPRVFSNGAVIDNSRYFLDLQDDCVRQMYGEFAIMAADAYDRDSGDSEYERMYNLTGMAIPENVDFNCFATKKQNTPTATKVVGDRRWGAGFTAYTDLSRIKDIVKNVAGNVLVFDSAQCFPNSDNKETRPTNFCVKMYIKA